MITTTSLYYRVKSPSTYLSTYLTVSLSFSLLSPFTLFSTLHSTSSLLSSLSALSLLFSSLLHSLSPLLFSFPLSSLLSRLLSSPGIAYRSVTRRSRAPWRHPCPRNSPPWGGNACKTRVVLNGLYECNWITWFILVYVIYVV